MSRSFHSQPNGIVILFKYLIAAVLLAGVGSAFVAVRNRQIAVGDQKRVLENEIKSLHAEIQEVEGQIIKALSRERLIECLERRESDLVSIDTSRRIIDVVPAPTTVEKVATADAIGGIRQTIGFLYR